MTVLSDGHDVLWENRGLSHWSCVRCLQQVESRLRKKIRGLLRKAKRYLKRDQTHLQEDLVVVSVLCAVGAGAVPVRMKEERGRLQTYYKLPVFFA